MLLRSGQAKLGGTEPPISCVCVKWAAASPFR